MAETNLNIILQLYDKATEGINKVSNNLENFSRSIKQVGRELSQVGSTLTMTGAAITGPFAIAFNNASKNVGSVNQSMITLQNSIDRFQESIAKNMIPVVDHVSSAINNLCNMFNSLSPAMQSSIVQGTLYAGVFLTIGGMFTMITGKIISLIANVGLLTSKFGAFVAANPELFALYGIIVAIAVAMLKWKVVADVVMNAFEITFLGLRAGFDSLVMTINGAILGIVQSLDWVMQQVARLPGPFGDVARSISDSLQGTMRVLSDSVNSTSTDFQKSTGEISNILTTGTSDWANGFDKLKVSISNTWTKLAEGGTVAATSAALFKKNWEGMKTAVGQLSSALMGYAAVNRDFAIAAQVVAIGMATMHTAEGIANALKLDFPLNFIVGGMIAAAGALQIATIASQQFATGTDSVPAMLTPGEMVFPRTMSDAIRSGDIAVSGRGGFDNARQTTNNISVEINYPTVRSNQDIEKITEEVSRRIALEAERL